MVQPAGAPSPGSQITRDYQYEYRGMLIGSGTPIVVNETKGLLDQPPIVQYHSKAVSKHGVYYGYEVFDARTIDFTVQTDSDQVGMVYPPTGITLGEIAERLMDEIAGAFTVPAPFANQLTTPLTVSQIDDPLVIKRPGKVSRQLWCHTTKRQPKATSDIATGLATIMIEMYAGDPVVYSLAPRQWATTVPAHASNSTQINIRNEGNFPSTRFTVTIGGPGGGGGNTLWTVDDLTSGYSLLLNMTLVGTDVVVIDFNAKTITLNGVNSYQFRAAGAVWWGLQPGDNIFQVTRQTTDSVASNISVTSYDGFNSA